MKRLILGAFIFLFFSGAAMALSAEDWLVRLEEAKVVMDSGDYTKAGAILEEVVKSHPESADANYYLGLVRIKEEKFAEAESYLNAANKLSPQNLLVLIDLGFVYLSTNRPKEAVAALDQVLKAQPANGRALFLRGMAALQQSDCKTASANLVKAKPLLAKSAAEIDYYLGLCAKSEGRRQEAVNYFDQAIKEGKGTAWEKKALEEKSTLPQRNAFFISADAVYQYDTNVVPVSGEEALPEEITHVEDSRGLVWFKAGLRPLMRDNAELALTYRLYNSWQFEETEMNLQIHQGEANGFLDFKLGTMPARLFAAYLYQYAGLGEGYEYYSTTHRAGPIFYLVESKATVTELSYSYQNEFFKEPGEEDFDRDNNAHLAQIGQHFYFGNGNLDFAVYGRYQSLNAKGINYDLNRYGGRAILQLIDWKKLAGWAYFDYDYRDYYDSTIDRTDEIYSGGAEVQYSILKGLALFVGASYSDHNSTVEPFDYTRAIYSAGIRAAY